MIWESIFADFVTVFAEMVSLFAVYGVRFVEEGQSLGTVKISLKIPICSFRVLSCSFSEKSH